MDAVLKYVPVNLKKLRKSRNMSQAAVGEIVDLMHAQISKYESGTTEIPLSTAFKLCNFFGINLDDLVAKDMMNNGYKNVSELKHIPPEYLAIIRTALSYDIPAEKLSEIVEFTIHMNKGSE